MFKITEFKHFIVEQISHALTTYYSKQLEDFKNISMSDHIDMNKPWAYIEKSDDLFYRENRTLKINLIQDIRQHFKEGHFYFFNPLLFNFYFFPQDFTERIFQEKHIQNFRILPLHKHLYLIIINE